MATSLFGELVDSVSDLENSNNLDSKILNATNSINRLKNQETEIYAKIGRIAMEEDCANERYAELAGLLRENKANIDSQEQALAKAKAEKEAQEQAECERLAKSTCPNCGLINIEGANFCKNCGVRLSLITGKQGVCVSCGTVNNSASNFCRNCGNKLNHPSKIECLSCGAEISFGTKFCDRCGTKI